MTLKSLRILQEKEVKKKKLLKILKNVADEYKQKYDLFNRKSLKLAIDKLKNKILQQLDKSKILYTVIDHRIVINEVNKEIILSDESIKFQISKNNFKEFKFKLENYNVDDVINYTFQDYKLSEISSVCNNNLDESKLKWYISELEKNMSKLDEVLENINKYTNIKDYENIYDNTEKYRNIVVAMDSVF